MITFELPTAPPSRNVLDKMHWANRDRLAQRFRQEIGLALVGLTRDALKVVPAGRGNRMLALALKEPAKGHRFVRIVRRGPRDLDDDNLSGGCKSLRDALKFVGLIEDDRPGLVTVDYKQERGSGCRVQVWSEEVTTLDDSAPSRNRGNRAENGPARAKVIPIKKRAIGALFERRGE